MEGSYNSLPLYLDIYFCQRCGSPLKDDKKLVNLELETNYQREIKRKCKKCGYSYNFISRIFIGANGEKHIAAFDPSGKFIIGSGILTKNGQWDPERIEEENRAKNFKINIELDKQRPTETQ